ncbi:PQQ-like beta-propeller repeat protein, partial [Rhodopirellula sp.]|nr:PQQ-like beta-propeller repeat protein [Rhodopirellula sp.]
MRNKKVTALGMNRFDKNDFGITSPLRLLVMVCVASNTLNLTVNAENWPSWRGPDSRGESNANPPIHWSTTQNVLWRKPIPGQGKSTPILWGEQMFLVTAIPKLEREKESLETDASPLESPIASETLTKSDASEAGSKIDQSQQYGWWVLSLDQRTGIENWRTRLASGFPLEPGHPTNSLASGSPVTDGKFLYVSLGSYGVFCVDLAGTLIWKRSLGDMQTRFGFGEASTPAVYEKTLIVPWDHEGDSAVFALDTSSGQTLWKTLRDEPTAWSTPL